MPHKDLATVRVSNLPPNWQREELLHLFESCKATESFKISLCASTAAEGAHSTATVTFNSGSEAKQALSLNGKVLRAYNISIDRDFMGLTVLAAPENSSVDIIAVHGLNGHAFGTWAYRDDHRSGAELMWLRDFLPHQAQEARIMVYGYNSALIGPDTSVSSVEDFSRDLLNRIADDRKFLTASGANMSLTGWYSCETAVRSVLFLATPHSGSKSANIGLLLSRVAALAFQRPSKQLLEALKLQSPRLCQLSSEFCAISSSMAIVNFYERRKTPGLNSLIVDEFSSKLGVEHESLIPMDATHRDICKFRAPSDALYLPVLAQIIRCLHISSSSSEETAVPVRATFPMGESQDGIAEQEGQFIVPVPPNPDFTGREKELVMIDEYLNPQYDNPDSTCPTVAVHGLGGVGWQDSIGNETSARSHEDIELGLQEITTRLYLTRDLNGPVHRPTLQEQRSTLPRFAESSEGLELLRDLMLSTDHEGWLLVLDNYDDIQIDIRTYLPIGISGRVLVTSRDRRVIGSVARSGFALLEMGIEDAKRLFLCIKGRCVGDEPKDCSTLHPDDDVLEQILQELQCFPLAIDQAAAFIRENAPMSLAEYLDHLRPRSVDRERLMRFKEANPTYPESVMTTWEISLHYLQQSQPRTSWILQVLGFLDHSYIAEKLLTATNEIRPWVFDPAFPGRSLSLDLVEELSYLNNDINFRLAIGTLTSLSLIKRNLSRRTLYVHPLVHEWIRVRLNADPARQAHFTVAATLILYQTFPLESVAWLPDKSPTMSIELHRRVDQSSHHLRAVLANIKDYHTHVATMPLECYTLLEIFYLTSVPKHGLYALELSKEMYSELDSVIRLMIPHLAQSHRTLAFFIHKVSIWLQDRAKSKDNYRVPFEIAKSLESLEPIEPKVLSGDDILTCIMLLAITIIDTCEYVAEIPVLSDSLSKHFKQLDMAAHKNAQYTKARVEKEEQSRKCTLRLLEGVYTILAPMTSTSQLMSWIAFIIQYRLLKIITPGEFEKRYVFNINQLISLEALGFLEFEQRASYLCRLTQLCWACDWPRNYTAIRDLFKITIRVGKAKLAQERRKSERKDEEELIRRSSYRNYISSSFGRSGQLAENSNKDLDIITLLGYIWAITLEVAEAISDPDTLWSCDSSNKSTFDKLGIGQRERALTLVSSTKELYQEIRKEQGSETRTEAALLQYFQPADVTSTLIAIYNNLTSWSQLEGSLWNALQCDSIMKWCMSSGSMPWESQKSQTKSQPFKTRTSEPQVVMTISKGTMTECSDIALDTSPHYPYLRQLDMPPESAPVILDNALKRWQAELIAAASERMAAASDQLQKVNSHFSTEELARRLRKMPILEQLSVPDSCDCILLVKIDDMISAFIAACKHREVISQQEASDVQAQSNFIKSIPVREARYLGRLEIIHRLANAVIVKAPEWNKRRPGLEAGDETEESSGSSEEEYTEAAEDIFQMDKDMSGTAFDWGW